MYDTWSLVIMSVQLSMRSLLLSPFFSRNINIEWINMSFNIENIFRRIGCEENTHIYIYNLHLTPIPQVRIYPPAISKHIACRVLPPATIR